MTEWIKVADKKPSKEGHMNHVVWNGRYKMIASLFGSPSGNKWFHDYHEKQIVGVTHYIELPDDPT